MQQSSSIFSVLSNIYVQNIRANSTTGDVWEGSKYTPEIACSKSFVYQWFYMDINI